MPNSKKNSGKPESNQVLSKVLAQRAGVPYTKIDYWSDMGLLEFERANGRTRLYGLKENLRRCRFIRKMQRQAKGYSLLNIKDMIIVERKHLKA